MVYWNQNKADISVVLDGWIETNQPDIDDSRKRLEEVRTKLLVVNTSVVSRSGASTGTKCNHKNGAVRVPYSHTSKFVTFVQGTGGKVLASALECLE